MTSFFRRHRPRIIALSCWIILLGTCFVIMSIKNYTPLDLLKIFYDRISNAWYGPLLFTLIYIIRPLFLFPASFLYALSGTVYGFWGGFLYTLVGAGISSMVAFFIGQYFAKDIHFDGKHKFIQKWQHEIEENGFAAVLIMRLIYLPFDVVNYGAALLKVGWKPFLAATLLSMIVDTGAFISFGATVKNIDSFDFSQIRIEPYQLMISFALLIFSFVVAFFVHRHHHHKRKLHENSGVHSNQY